MPMDPILPAIDWQNVFSGGVEFDQWLDRAASPANAARMREAEKAMGLDHSREATLAGLARTVKVVAIAEDWCGDVIRWAPLMARIARASGGKLRLRFIERADRPDVFARFLTNGGEAIPKFVFLNEAFVECGNWGPYPAECRRVMNRGKGSGDMAAARRRVAKLYDADPDNEGAARELMELVEAASCARP